MLNTFTHQSWEVYSTLIQSRHSVQVNLKRFISRCVYFIFNVTRHATEWINMYVIIEYANFTSCIKNNQNSNSNILRYKLYKQLLISTKQIFQFGPNKRQILPSLEPCCSCGNKPPIYYTLLRYCLIVAQCVHAEIQSIKAFAVDVCGTAVHSWEMSCLSRWC